jgi:diacylglycerol O-acyltransferase / wax synthase
VDQLSAMDAAFLYIEAPSVPQHVLGVMLLDAEGSEGRYSTERFLRVVEDRLHLMPAFNRRLAQVPLNLDHPYWVQQPDVDLDQHVSTLTCPAPGDLHALGRLVGELGSEPLPRDRPLWQLWLVDGLADGSVAMVAKLHHSTLYGAAGADMMAQLLDLDPDGREVEPAEPFVGEPRPRRCRCSGGRRSTAPAGRSTASVTCWTRPGGSAPSGGWSAGPSPAARRSRCRSPRHGRRSTAG